MEIPPVTTRYNYIGYILLQLRQLEHQIWNLGNKNHLFFIDDILIVQLA